MSYTCPHCDSERVPIGTSVKCFDCGLTKGGHPGLKSALLKTVAYVSEHTPMRLDSIVSEPEPDVIRLADSHGQSHRVRVVDLVADTDEIPPIQPGLHPSLYEGVEYVAVYYRDLGVAARYEAKPYHERTHAQHDRRQRC